DRGVLHRELALSIQRRNPGLQDENAALIAEHSEAAGELRDAYAWHMRAGAWSTNRDTAAAHVSWERAQRIADSLPEGDHDRLEMRIAPRSLICGNAWRIGVPVKGARFEELRNLCDAAGDKASLAIGMAGLCGDHMMLDRGPEAEEQAWELAALLESIDDPQLSVALSVAPIAIYLQIGEMREVLRWSQMVIDSAEGKAEKVGIILGSPLGAGYASRSVARWATGKPGWRDDIDRSIALARTADAM